MKKLFLGIVFTLFVNDAFADDWRMKRFDLDSNGFVTVSELEALDCPVNRGLWKQADKDGNGVLNAKELRKSSMYIINRCAGKVA